MKTFEKGDLVVSELTSKFIRLGYKVLRPVSDGYRYDLVIDRGNGFESVQCKSGRFQNGCVVFNTCSSSNGRTYENDVDLFGVYCDDNHCCYLVPSKQINTRTRTALRIVPAKNNQQNALKAVEFEL